MRKLTLAISTGLGLGYSPYMPGTVGTLLGLPFVFLWPSNIWIILAITILGLIFAHQGEKYLGHDNPKIVIDEVAGYIIGMYGMGFGWALPAFVFFRFFDIVKPQPIKGLQKLPGGVGIMVDDLAAGLLTNIALRLIEQFVK